MSPVERFNSRHCIACVQRNMQARPRHEAIDLEYMEKIAEKIHGISINGGDLVLDQLRQLFVRQP